MQGWDHERTRNKPLTYNGYVTAVGTMAVIASPETDPNLTALIPQMLNYAELRIQRDLNLLPLQTDNSGYPLTAGNNVLSLSMKLMYAHSDHHRAVY